MPDKRKKKEARRTARKDAAQRKRAARAPRDDQGRVHLTVHHDAFGRRVGLALSQPLFDQRWQNDVAIGAANTTHASLASGATLANAVELGLSVMAGTSKIADGALARSTDRQPACGAGCAHCCHQAVGVSPPEVFAIHDHLRATRSPGDFEVVAGRIRAADDRTRGLAPAQRLSPDLPCPFLDDGRCSIYAVRPLACRGTNSLDAAACERNLHDPQARAAFLGGQASVPCFIEPIRAFHAVAAGMQLALADLHGLRVQPLELTAAMRIMVDDPASVAERWLSGDDPFAPAQGADNTDNPLMRELTGRRAP